jgi:hypothetical protein
MDGPIRYSSLLTLQQCSANFFPPVAHPNLSSIHYSTPQNFASQKGGTKLYMAINMYLHINPCPIRMQAYENKTLYVLKETIDDGPVCVCVCVCARARVRSFVRSFVCLCMCHFQY